MGSKKKKAAKTGTAPHHDIFEKAVQDFLREKAMEQLVDPYIEALTQMLDFVAKKERKNKKVPLSMLAPVGEIQTENKTYQVQVILIEEEQKEALWVDPDQIKYANEGDE